MQHFIKQPAPLTQWCAFVKVCWQCSADVYLHSPRSSNNRLNEQNVNRDNNNRLFDSQNNNKGGYSVGVDDDDYEVRICPGASLLCLGSRVERLALAQPLICFRFQNEDLQAPDDGPAGYVTPPMDMVEGAPLPIEWTNQHACGPNVVVRAHIDPRYCNVHAANLFVTANWFCLVVDNLRGCAPIHRRRSRRGRAGAP